MQCNNPRHQQPTRSLMKQAVHTVHWNSNPSIVNSSVINQLIQSSPNKNCTLDPVPTWMIKQYASELVSFITVYCNTSFRDGSIQFNSIQAFIDAAYMHGQRRLTISSKSKSALILVSVRTINLVEKKSFKFFPETRRVSGCTQL